MTIWLGPLLLAALFLFIVLVNLMDPKDPAC
jgi:hypothetical protein